MIARGSPGSIVNVSSVAAVRAAAALGAKELSKGDQLTRVMTLELGPHKVGSRLAGF